MWFKTTLVQGTNHSNVHYLNQFVKVLNYKLWTRLGQLAFGPNKAMADMKHINPFEKNGILSEKDLPNGIKRVLQIHKMMDYINNPTIEKPQYIRPTGSYHTESIDTFKDSG